MKKILFTLLAVVIYEFSYGQVTEGLVAHFTFNNGSFTDLAGYQDCVLSSNGDSVYFLSNDRFENPDYAIDFQGAVLNGGIISRDITTEVTVSLWMKTIDNPDEVKFIINKYYCVEPPQGYHLVILGDSVTFGGRDNTANGYMRAGWSETDVNDGEWHHVVGLARAEGNWEIWVDSHKESSSTYSPLSSLNHSSCRLGIAGTDYIDENSIYTGHLDDIRIYNRALDSLEIDSLFNEPNPINTGFYKPPSFSLMFKITPNPFTTSTTLSYELKQPKKVALTIYDYLGVQVYQAQENQLQGKQQLIWNAESYAEGVYYYRLKVGDVVANGKMVKVR